MTITPHAVVLTVKDVTYETENAVSLTFDVPPTHADAMRYLPGQHLGIAVDIGDQTVRRTYSISSTPYSGDDVRITVKRQPMGLVSNHLFKHAEVGQRYTITPPFGRFTVDCGPTKRRSHYFFAAGSGITPVMSMVHSVLLAEPHSACFVLYANRDVDETIFFETLDGLSQTYPARLRVHHVHSKAKMLSTFWPWRTGRVDGETIAAFIDACRPEAQDAHYYMCGPAGFMDAVRAGLSALDVPTGRMHETSFGGRKTPAAKAEMDMDAALALELGGKTHDVPVSAGQSLLHAALDAGVDVPYSCESGVCGTCVAKLAKGDVHMAHAAALSPADRAAGRVLLCQAKARSPTLSARVD